MVYSLLADLVVILHAAFVLFVILGGIPVFWVPRFAWCHIPAACWAAALEFGGWICPLTPLENRLRHMAGESGYGTGFIEHYIVPILYPAVLTRKLQIILGIIVIVINVGIYGAAWYRTRRIQRNLEK